MSDQKSVVQQRSTIRSEVHVPHYRDDSQGRVVHRMFHQVCDDCDRSFSSKSQLSRHRRDKHGPQVHCYHCGKEFAQSRNFALQLHLRNCEAKYQRTRQSTERSRSDRRSEKHQKQVSNTVTNPRDITLAALNCHSNDDDTSDLTYSPQNNVDLSGSLPTVDEADNCIQTFSLYDQTEIMNGFTNLNVPDQQSYMSNATATATPATSNSGTKLADTCPRSESQGQSEKSSRSQSLPVSSYCSTLSQTQATHTATLSTETSMNNMSSRSEQNSSQVYTIQSIIDAVPTQPMMPSGSNSQQTFYSTNPLVTPQFPGNQYYIRPSNVTACTATYSVSETWTRRPTMTEQITQPGSTLYAAPSFTAVPYIPYYQSPRPAHYFQPSVINLSLQQQTEDNLGTALDLSRSSCNVNTKADEGVSDVNLSNKQDDTTHNKTAVTSSNNLSVSTANKSDVNPTNNLSENLSHSTEVNTINKPAVNPVDNQAVTSSNNLSVSIANNLSVTTHLPDVNMSNMSDVNATNNVPVNASYIPDVNRTKPDVNCTKPDVNRTKPDVNCTKPDVNRTKPDVNCTNKPDVSTASTDVTRQIKRAKLSSPPESPRSPMTMSPTPSEEYSPSMPDYESEAESVPEYVPTSRGDCPSFPPKQIKLHQPKSKDRYGYLLHDPRTLFAGAPSSFLKDADSNYASKLGKKALQIGVKPENISYCQEGHTITRTEFVKQGDFLYKLQSTLTPVSKPTRLREFGTQTEDNNKPRCRPGCPGCGMVFTCERK